MGGIQRRWLIQAAVFVMVLASFGRSGGGGSIFRHAGLCLVLSTLTSGEWGWRRASARQGRSGPVRLVLRLRGGTSADSSDRSSKQQSEGNERGTKPRASRQRETDSKKSKTMDRRYNLRDLTRSPLPSASRVQQTNGQSVADGTGSGGAGGMVRNRPGSKRVDVLDNYWSGDAVCPRLNL